MSGFPPMAGVKVLILCLLILPEKHGTVVAGPELRSCDSINGACKCYEQENCIYDSSSKSCVESAIHFSDYYSCLHEDSFYKSGAKYCSGYKSKKDCSTGELYYALNLGGEAYEKYEADEKIIVAEDICSKERKNDPLHAFGINGDGECPTYSIPVGGSGMYEMEIVSIPLKNRCIDVKFGDVVVASNVDIWALSEEVKCKVEFSLIIKYVVEREAGKIYVKGMKNWVGFQNGYIPLQICACESKKRSRYSASTIKITKFGCKRCEYKYPDKQCQYDEEEGEECIERDMYDRLGCKLAGLEYNIQGNNCIRLKDDCVGAFGNNYGADFNGYCREADAFYAFIGGICNQGDVYWHKDGCKKMRAVYAVNLGSPENVKYENVQYIGEGYLAEDKYHIREIGDASNECLRGIEGPNKNGEGLYKTFVYTSNLKPTEEPMCITYQIPIVGQGFHEIKLGMVTLVEDEDSESNMCMDVYINERLIVSALDVAEYVNGSCQSMDLRIPVLLQASNIQPGDHDELRFVGQPMSSDDTTKEREMPGLIPLKLCNCRSDSNGFRISSLSVSWQEESERDEYTNEMDVKCQLFRTDKARCFASGCEFTEGGNNGAGSQCRYFGVKEVEKADAVEQKEPPCKSVTDACKCYELENCRYNPDSKKCVDSDTNFSNYFSCLQPNSFYQSGARYCTGYKNKKDCAKGELYYALNVGGPPHLRYEGDDRIVQVQDECSEKVKDSILYSHRIVGDGDCLSYTIPVGGSAMYEMEITSVTLENRCADVKFEDVVVARNVDIWKLGGKVKCRESSLIIKYVIGENFDEIYVKGVNTIVPFENSKFKLKICACESKKNSKYSASTFKITKFGCKNCEMEFPEKCCYFDKKNGEQCFEKEMYDRLACRHCGLEYNIQGNNCCKMRKSCTGVFRNDDGVDFRDYCREPGGFYAHSGGICNQAEYWNEDGCKMKKAVVAVNLGSEEDIEYENVRYIGEGRLAEDELKIREVGDASKACPEKIEGVDKNGKKLYSSFVYTKGIGNSTEERQEPMCITYQLPVVGQGFYEVKLGLVSLEGDFEMCLDLYINERLIVSALDVSKYINSSCQSMDLRIPFVSKESSIEKKGKSQEVRFVGLPLSKDDTSKQRQIPGLIPLRLCNCRSDFIGGFRISTLSVSRQQISESNTKADLFARNDVKCQLMKSDKKRCLASGCEFSKSGKGSQCRYVGGKKAKKHEVVEVAVKPKEAPCDSVSDPCKCYELEDCTYDSTQKLCVDSDTQFSDYYSCLQADSHYQSGSQHCTGYTNRKDCAKGELYYGLNLRGPPYHKYEGDDMIVETKDECSEKWSWNALYSYRLIGHGECPSYTIPVGGSGMYELKIISIALENRCTDIKFNDVVVAQNVDIWALSGREKCKEFQLVIKYVVEDDFKLINVKGSNKTVPFENSQFTFKLCACKSKKMSKYSASAIKITKFGCKGCDLSYSEKHCHYQGDKEECEEKDMYDRIGCRHVGLEYNSKDNNCVKMKENCTGVFKGDDGSDFRDYCREPGGFYAHSGGICKQGPEYWNENGCKNKKAVHAVNIGSEDDIEYENVQFIGDQFLGEDQLGMGQGGNALGACPDKSLGMNDINGTTIYTTFVQTNNGRKPTSDPMCIIYQVPIFGQGFHEIKLGLVTLQGDKNMCLDLYINERLIVSALDVSKYIKESCQSMDLRIPLVVQQSTISHIDSHQEVRFLGHPLSSNDTTRGRQIPGLMPLKVCNCRSDFNKGFRISALSVTSQRNDSGGKEDRITNRDIKCQIFKSDKKRCLASGCEFSDNAGGSQCRHALAKQQKYGGGESEEPCYSITDPCKCYKKEDCFYDSDLESCVDAAIQYSDYSSCLQPDSFYQSGSKYCTGYKNKKNCSRGEPYYALNVGGPPYHKYEGDDKIVDVKDECSEKWKWNDLYRHRIVGDGTCLTYSIPVGGSGMYEMKITSIALEDRCIDVKFEDVVVAQNVNIWKLSGKLGCKEFSLGIKYVVEDDFEWIHVKGEKFPIYFSDSQFNLEICACESKKNSKYSASKLEITKFACCKNCNLRYSEKHCYYDGKHGEKCVEKDMYDRLGCRHVGLEYSFKDNNCVKMRENCVGVFGSEDGADFREYCREPDVFYAHSGGICKQGNGPSYWNEDGCKMRKAVHAINLGSNENIEYEKVQYIGEGSLVEDNYDIREKGNAARACPDKIDGLKTITARELYNSFIYTTGIRTKMESMCITYQLPIIGQGFHELKLGLITLEADYDMCLDVFINERLIVSALDVSKYLNDSCQAMDLRIPLMVQSSSIEPKGESQEVRFIGRHLSINDTSKVRQIPGIMPLKLCNCKSDFNNGFRISALSISHQQSGKEDEAKMLQNMKSIKCPLFNSEMCRCWLNGCEFVEDGEKTECRFNEDKSSADIPAQCKPKVVVPPPDKNKCGSYANNVCKCFSSGCYFDTESRNCVAHPSQSIQSVCRRKQAYYPATYNQLCLAEEPTDTCSTAKSYHGINFNGHSYVDTQGFKYIGERKLRGIMDPKHIRVPATLPREKCTMYDIPVEDRDTLYLKYVFGKKEKSSPGICMGYPVKFEQEGEYELTVKTVSGMHGKTSFQIKFNNDLVARNIDLNKLNGSEQCSVVNIVFLFKVSESLRTLTIHDLNKNISMNKAFQLFFCYGGGGGDSEEDLHNSFYISAMSLVRFGDDTKVPDEIARIGEELPECKKLGNDPCGCDLSNCFYSAKKNTCFEFNDLSAKKNKHLLKEKPPCIRNGIHYAFAPDRVCEANRKSGNCEPATITYALSFNAEESVDGGLRFLGEKEGMADDKNGIREGAKLDGKCLLDNATDAEEMVYGSFIYGSTKKGSKGDCIGYTLPIIQDGEYELVVMSLEAHHSNVGVRLFDIKLNGQEAVTNIDLVERGGGRKCVAVDIAIQFEVDGGGKILRRRYRGESDLSDKIKVDFCLSKQNVQDPGFEVSALYLIRYGNDTIIPKEYGGSGEKSR